MGSPTVPIFDPQGTLRDVPFENMHDAIAAGGKPALRFQAPDQSVRYVPADKSQDAVKAGGKILPIQQQSDGVPELYGFTPTHLLSNAWEGVKGTAKGAYELGKDLVNNPNWVEGDNSTLHKFVEQPMLDQSKKAAADLQAGNTVSGIGHTVASGIPLVGPWAASLGEQAGSGDVGGALAKGAAQVATPIAAGKAIGAVKDVVSPIAQATAERMYQSTLKPSLAKNAPDAAGLVKTGLENEIPISKNGLDKLSNLIGDLQQKVSDTIASDPTKTIDKLAVTSRLGKTMKQFETQVNPEADLNAIADSRQEFLKNQPDQIPVQDAQALKVGTYRQLKAKAYGEMKSASIEAQKSLARGIKEELVNQFPELTNLNAQEGKLIDLDGALEHAVKRIDNHQLLGIGTPLAMGAGGVVAGGTGGVIAGLVKGIVDNPLVKSKLAIALNKAARGSAPMAAVNAKVGAYSAALGNAATAQENGDQKDQQ